MVRGTSVHNTWTARAETTFVVESSNAIGTTAGTPIGRVGFFLVLGSGASYDVCSAPAARGRKGTGIGTLLPTLSIKYMVGFPAQWVEGAGWDGISIRWPGCSTRQGFFDSLFRGERRVVASLGYSFVSFPAWPCEASPSFRASIPLPLRRRRPGARANEDEQQRLVSFGMNRADGPSSHPPVSRVARDGSRATITPAAPEPWRRD